MAEAQSVHSPFIVLVNIGERYAGVSYAINEKLTPSKKFLNIYLYYYF